MMPEVIVMTHFAALSSASTRAQRVMRSASREIDSP